jgi:hypothetical protein
MSALGPIRRAIADFDALHGRGAAWRDLALGALSCVVILLEVAILAAGWGGQ